VGGGGSRTRTGAGRRATMARGCTVQVGTDMLFEMIPAYLEFFGFGTSTLEELRRVVRLRYRLAPCCWSTGVFPRGKWANYGPYAAIYGDKTKPNEGHPGELDRGKALSKKDGSQQNRADRD
jgi:hypothetical protein